MNTKQVVGSVLLTTFLFTNTTIYADTFNNTMRISAYYQETSNIHKVPHKGIDIALNKGTPIASYSNGVVEDVRNYGNKGFGKVVYVRDQYGSLLIYAHLNEFKVNKGDTIHFGDIIGLVGSTGRSTGSHLHFQVNIKGKDTNPMLYLQRTNMRATIKHYFQIK